MAAANISNTTGLNKVKYMAEALPIMEYNLVMNKFGQEDEMPRSEGTSFSWIKFTKLDSTASGYTVNATGDSPTWTPDDISTAPITVTPDYLFGNGVEWNSAREYTSWADIPKNMRKNLSVQAAEVIDKRITTVLLTGTQVIYAGAKAARQDLLAADVLTMKDIFRAAAKLATNGAKPVAKFGKYCAVISPMTQVGLLFDTNFKALVELARPQDLFSGRIGTLGGVDFWMSQYAPTVSLAGSASAIATVDQTLVFGEGAYGVSKIMFSDFDIIYTAPGGHGDEWKNKHKLTWKAAMKAVILEDLAMVRIESARDPSYA